MKFVIFLLIAQLVFAIYQWVLLRNLKSRLQKAQNKSLSFKKKQETLLHSLYIHFEKLSQSREMPFLLKNIPFADEEGIVTSVKTIQVPSVSSPYNASIGQADGGYLLFFRFDIPSNQMNSIPFFSHIGCIRLGKDFEPLEKQFSQIETNSVFSEDARFFQHEGCHFLVYNDLVSTSNKPQNSKNPRSLRLAAIDVTTKSIKYVTNLQSHSKKMEKNWTPFSYNGAIHFLYTIHPQKILKLPDPKENRLESFASSINELEWPKKWGDLRGGTPAQLVDEEYLAFFHSSFEDHKGMIWYIMGAYTFQASHPFRMTRISPHPILFKGIYDTDHQNIANPKMRSLYPVGFVYEQEEGKQIIHVSCGENDSGIKIVSIDKNALMANLQIL